MAFSVHKILLLYNLNPPSSSRQLAGWLLTLWFSVLFGYGRCQEGWQLLRTMPIAHLEKVQVDKFGNLYAVDRLQNILKYDSAGNILERFSKPRTAQVSHLQVSQGVQIIAFYEGAQEVLITNRFLGQAQQFSLEHEDVGYVAASCMSQDGNFWLFDADAFSLKKYNSNLRQVFLEFPLNFVNVNDLDIHQIWEQDNHVFAFTTQHVLAFSPLGDLTYQHAWEAEGLVSGVSNGTAWSASQSLLEIWNYEQDLTQKRALPTSAVANLYYLGSDEWLVVTPQSVKIYKWREGVKEK